MLGATTLLAVTLAAAPADSPALGLVEQHTFTGDVERIVIARGRVWAATRGGLAVHDARDGRFLFKLTTAHGLPSNSLRVVASLDPDRLLVGSDFGAVVVDHLEGESVEALAVEPIAVPAGSRGYTPIVDVAVTATATFLVSPTLGLLQLERQEQGASMGSSAPRRPALRAVAAHLRLPAGLWQTAAARDGVLAVGGLDGTLVVRGSDRTLAAASNDDNDNDNDANGTTLHLQQPVVASVAGTEAHVVAAVDRLYLLTSHGLRPVFVRGGGGALRSPTALAAATDQETTLVGTADGAVYRVHGDEAMRIAGGLGARVTALAADATGIWVALAADGLHRLAAGTLGASLRPAGEICSNHVTSMTRFHGQLVAGTFASGACVLTDTGWRPLPGLARAFVHGVASDGAYLWVAHSNGLWRFDGDLARAPLSAHEIPGWRWLEEVGTVALHTATDGTIAFANRYGAGTIRRAGARWRVRFFTEREGAPRAMTAVGASVSALYAASELDGITVFGSRATSPRRLQDPVHLPESWVVSLEVAGVDRIWAGTNQSGLALIEGGKARFIGRRQGLPDDSVVAVAAASGGAFAGTLAGLAYVPEGSLGVRAFEDGLGLPDPRSASLYVEETTLWVGTEAGLARFAISH